MKSQGNLPSCPSRGEGASSMESSLSQSRGLSISHSSGEYPQKETQAGDQHFGPIIRVDFIDDFHDDRDDVDHEVDDPPLLMTKLGGNDDNDQAGIGRLSKSGNQQEIPHRYGTSLSNNSIFNRSEFSLLPSRGARFQMRLEQLKSSSPSVDVFSEKDNKENHDCAPQMPSSSSPPLIRGVSNATLRDVTMPDLLPRVDAAILTGDTDDLWNTFSLIPSRNTNFAKKIERLKATRRSLRDCGKQPEQVVSVDVIDTNRAMEALVSDRTQSDYGIPACKSILSSAADIELQEFAPSNMAVDACQHKQDGRKVQIPAILLIQYIASYIGDRSTWNAIATLNKEIYSLSQNLTHLYRPWPSVRWRVASGRAWSVAFGEDYLCCGTDQGTLLVWKVNGCGSAVYLNHNLVREGGGRQPQAECGSGRINCIQCHGDWIVSAGDNRLACLWNVRTWSCEATLEGHAGSITSLSILRKDGIRNEKPNGRSSLPSCMWIATASLDFDIRLYAVVFQDVRILSTKCLRAFVGSHNGPVYSVVMYEKYGKSCLVSGGLDERLRMWDISHCEIATEPMQVELVEGTEGSKCMFRSEGEIRSIAVSQRQNLIAASFGRNVFYCNLLNGYLCPDQRQGTEHDQGLVVLDDACGPEGWRDLKGHSSNIRCIDFSPDGKLIASACSDGTIRLWTLGEGTWTRKWKAHNGFMVPNLAFSPDGQSLLSVGSDGTIAIEKL